MFASVGPCCYCVSFVMAERVFFVNIKMWLVVARHEKVTSLNNKTKN
jgi:hypothetical protein